MNIINIRTLAAALLVFALGLVIVRISSPRESLEYSSEALEASIEHHPHRRLVANSQVRGSRSLQQAGDPPLNVAISSLNRIQGAGDTINIEPDDIKELRVILSSLNSEELIQFGSALSEDDNPRILDLMSFDLLNLIARSDSDLQTIISWVSSINGSTQRSKLLWMTGATLASTRGISVKEVMLNIESESDKIKILKGHCSSLVSSQPRVAISDFISNLPRDRSIDEFSDVIAGLGEKTNYEHLIGVLFIETSNDYPDLISTTLKRWGEYDPGSSVYFSYINDSINEDQLAAAVEVWAGSEPKSVSEWIGTLPVSEKRDAALKSYSLARSATNPSDAWSSALIIHNPMVRSKTLEKVYSEWVRYQPDEANRAMSEVGLKP